MSAVGEADSAVQLTRVMTVGAPAGLKNNRQARRKPNDPNKSRARNRNQQGVPTEPGRQDGYVDWYTGETRERKERS